MKPGSARIDDAHAPFAQLASHAVLPNGLGLGVGRQRLCRSRESLEPAEHAGNQSPPRRLREVDVLVVAES